MSIYARRQPWPVLLTGVFHFRTVQVPAGAVDFKPRLRVPILTPEADPSARLRETCAARPRGARAGQLLIRPYEI